MKKIVATASDQRNMADTPQSTSKRACTQIGKNSGMCFCSCLKAKLNSSMQTNINSILTHILFDIPALPSCVSTVRLKVTVPMSCCPGIVILAHSSTCSSLSLTLYVCLSNPTTTAVNHNNKKHNNKCIHLSCSQHINTELNS